MAVKGAGDGVGGRRSAWSRATRRWRWAAVALIVVLLSGLVSAGAAGAVRYVDTFWLYRGFPAPQAPRSVAVHQSGGGRRRAPVVLPTVQSITVRSPALGGYPDPVYVALPPGYASHPRRRYPVLYLLHGSPGQPQQFLTTGRVATTEATLVAEGRMAPMILVMPAGGRSLLADEEWANGIHPGNDWETFVARSLVHAVDARYRAIPGRQGRGIAGLSEGGYGALNIGLHHVGEFGFIESWSGYMTADRIPAIFGHSLRARRANSPAREVVRAAPRLRATRTGIWFYVGVTDPMAAQNRAFATELAALGVPHHFFESTGGHNWGLWRRLMPASLLAASAHLSHG